ncbi:MAG: hypothetical protein IJE92_00715 [Clostridia bacterium]|nr:hypothetical protein [Clostridia bacterium]
MDENNKGTIIAVKSNKFTVLEAIGTIPSFGVGCPLLYAYNVTKEVIILVIGIILIAIGVWALCLTIGNAIKPNVLIEDHGDRIVIYESGGRQTELRFADIDGFIPRPMHAKHITYKFGNLLIKAQGATYKVGVMKDVEEVSQKLYAKIAYKYKY